MEKGAEEQVSQGYGEGEPCPLHPAGGLVPQLGPQKALDQECGVLKAQIKATWDSSQTSLRSEPNFGE